MALDFSEVGPSSPTTQFRQGFWKLHFLGRSFLIKVLEADLPARLELCFQCVAKTLCDERCVGLTILFHHADNEIRSLLTQVVQQLIPSDPERVLELVRLGFDDPSW